ncbi:unnamed protein product [marine sediment metagenome]|uniref:Uncharacterized protein n=1 Tax=marine sediment metagenome TaxID=412755 RepID=X0UH35_9ZZZZ
MFPEPEYISLEEHNARMEKQRAEFLEDLNQIKKSRAPSITTLHKITKWEGRQK